MSTSYCNTFFFLTLLSLSLATVSPRLLAEEGKIYKTRDANGNIIFSDTAIENADEVDVAEPMTYQPTKITNRLSPTQEKAPSVLSYQSIKITDPINEDAIRSNNGFLSVSFTVKPPLQAIHTVQLVMDGKVMKTTKTESSFDLENVDRGTHSLQINVIDDDSGKILKSSDVLNTTILRYSILLNPRNNRGD